MLLELAVQYSSSINAPKTHPSSVRSMFYFLTCSRWNSRQVTHGLVHSCFYRLWNKTLNSDTMCQELSWKWSCMPLFPPVLITVILFLPASARPNVCQWPKFLLQTRSFHWLQISLRIQFKILVITVRALHDQAPAYIKQRLQPYNTSRELRASEQGLLSVPDSKLKEKLQHSNSSASGFMFCGSMQLFKKQL